MVTAIAQKATRFGRYTLLGHIADGGMASVYLAQLRGDDRFAKWVALKVVHPRHAGEVRFEKMFLTEARIVARIDHPNVAQVFDCGKVQGTLYLAMEYLSGHTLQTVIQKAQEREVPIPLPIAARIIADAALGLQAAHEVRNEAGELENIVHRDVSPHNIFVLYTGSSKVMDFGIAQSSERNAEENTGTDELKGKLAYMSPEQLRRLPLDRRSDIFSLAVVLWEMTCGLRLFKRNSEGETAIALLSEPITTPSSVRPDYSPDLEQVIMRALDRDVDQRYQRASELADDLEQFIASTGRAAGAAQVAAFMQSLFPSATDEHSTALRRASELIKRGDLSVEIILARDEGDRETEQTQTAAGGRGSLPGVPVVARPRRRWWIGAAVVAVAVVIGFVILWSGPFGAAPPSPAAARPNVPARALERAAVEPPDPLEVAAPPQQPPPQVVAVPDPAEPERARDGWRRRPAPRAGTAHVATPSPAAEPPRSPPAEDPSPGPMTEFE